MLVRLVIGLNSLVSLYIEHRTAAAVLGYYCMKLYQLSGNRSVKNATGSVYMGSKWMGNVSHCLIQSSIQTNVMTVYLSLCMWQPFPPKSSFF